MPLGPVFSSEWALDGQELKPDKAAGSDGFLPKVFKAVADGVDRTSTRPSTNLWPKQRLPLNFKPEDLCTIPKRGLLTEICNYRPISLTSVPLKSS